jgi:hypothetical protein
MKNNLYTSIMQDSLFTPALKDQIDQVRNFQAETQRFVKKVIKGTHKNAVLQGPPGLGKSYVVQSELHNRGLSEGEDFIILKGHITNLQLFSVLYLFRRKGQVVVLDDCDDVMNNEIGMSLVKAATDPDNRRLSWHSSRSPVINDAVVNDFVFNGTLIICSNVALVSGRRGRRDQHMAAIMSRATIWPMGWDTRERKFAQIFNMVVNEDYLAGNPQTRLNNKQKADMLKFILENLNEIRSLDLRLPQKIAAEINEGGNWRSACLPFMGV